MNSARSEEFDCCFLDEGFTAKDILDQKINEVSSSVSETCETCRACGARARAGLSLAVLIGDIGGGP